jgi:transcriptional regulator with XRE-family HTH domain
MKTDKKKEALRLRLEEHLSLEQISQRTGLAKSTLSVALRDHPLTKERIDELCYPSRVAGAHANKTAATARKEIAKEEGRMLIRESDAFKSLCLLYWGEGSKFVGNNRFCIANADAEMIRFIVDVLTELGYHSYKAISYCYDTFSDEEIIEYWKPFIKIDCRVYRVKKSIASLNKRGKTIPHGTMRLEINDSKMYHRVLGGIESLRGR